MMVMLLTKMKIGKEFYQHLWSWVRPRKKTQMSRFTVQVQNEAGFRELERRARVKEKAENGFRVLYFSKALRLMSVVGATETTLHETFDDLGARIVRDVYLQPDATIPNEQPNK